MLRYRTPALIVLIMMAVWSGASSQGQDPTTTIAAQREAMKALAFLDGAWRGQTWTLLPSGEKHNLTQTERVGSFLDGSVTLDSRVSSWVSTALRHRATASESRNP